MAPSPLSDPAPITNTMPSLFAWLDSSERDRRRALDVIDLFQQKETVDELGLGSVRDTVADVLAPGISTIQTRARYFLFITWIFQALERTSAGRSGLAAEARKAEIRLMAELAQAKDDGTIGLRAGPSLKRLPSTIYWSGLRRLGFKLSSGGISHYLRTVERSTLGVPRDESGDLRVDAPTHQSAWNPHVPPAPAGFPSQCTFRLTTAESDFFRDQLRLRASGSLLHFLVERGEQINVDIEFPWRHPAVPEMSPVLQQWLHDARSFSELMHGVQIFYNLLLAQKIAKDELIQSYTADMQVWATRIERHREEYAAWNRAEFWNRLRQANANIPAGVQTFAERWRAQRNASTTPTRAHF